MKLELPNYPLLLAAFGISLLAFVAGTVALLVSFFSLPPEVPLLFTAGEELTNKIFLFAVPVLTLLFLAGDAYACEVFLRRREPSAALFSAFLALFVSVILSSSLIRILRIFPLPTLPFEKEIYPLLLPFGAAIVACFLLSALAILISRRLKLFDQPHGPYPQVRPIPRLGALPLFLTFALISPFLATTNSQLLAVLLGGAIITLIQTIDDLRPLPALVQGAGHLLAGLIVSLGGVGIDFVNNPLASWTGEPYLRFEAPLSNLLTVIWVFALINIVDWLDGLDGLAAGVGAIAGVAIIAISFVAGTPETAILGAILTGALLGLLPFNFFPARIYLGGGAFLLGYFLAVLSIFSGAKTGTAILVLALPIIDALYVVYRRVREGRSPFHGDLTHLHHRLLEVGLTQPQIVFLEWGIVSLLAVAAIVFSGFYKLVAIGAVFIAALLANKWLLSKLGSKSRSQKALESESEQGAGA